MKLHFVLLALLLLISLSYCYAKKSSRNEKSFDVLKMKFTNHIFGENTFVFDTTNNIKDVQAVIDSVFNRMGNRKAHFSNERYAFLFQPGTYHLDLRVGYFTHVAGLGASPKDVVIVGAVRSNSFMDSGNVLINFWRAVENLTIIPTQNNTNVWAVSQAAPIRRVYVKGNLKLHDNHYASGGFLADSKIDGLIDAGQQQQWYTRNTEFGSWEGGSWNIFFQGVASAPAENWPEKPITVVAQTPIIREKPFLVCTDKFQIKIPQIRANAIGPSWLDKNYSDKTLSLEDFYVAIAPKDNAKTINAALTKGKHILFTPGIYELEEPLFINKDNVVLLGIGMASLVPVNGNMAIQVGEVAGVTMAGIMIDAGAKHSDILLQVGNANSEKDNSANPTFLSDVYVRVGGPFAGLATSCLVINSNDVVIDHTWLWRADHGNGVGWDINKSANGIVVNGDRVTIYGLFCEHFQEYQTLWNGENGSMYFYQCEMPYDPPTAKAWTHNGINGYAAYKVSDNVKSHRAWGLGIYNVFKDAPVIVDQAIECPENIENDFYHIVTFFLSGNENSKVLSIINGKGLGVNPQNRKANY